MELEELQRSPKFPARAGSSQSSTPLGSGHTPQPHSTLVTIEENGTEVGSGLPQIKVDLGECPREGVASSSNYSLSTDNTENSTTKSKNWLPSFHPTDLLSRWKKYGPDSRSEADTKSDADSVSPFVKHLHSDGVSKVGVIEKDDKVFTVGAQDVGLLERIAQRERKGALRIRKPHEVHVELEELRMDAEEGVSWAETARWIKFEEDVEEGSGKWGRPHISALAFHSLVEVQRGLENGCVLLDVGGSSFPEVVAEIVVSFVKEGHVPASCATQLETLLLRKHKHHAHSSDHTLWDRIKSSAHDGALHQIGEGLRRKSSSANVLGTGVGQGGGGNHGDDDAGSGDHRVIPAVTLSKRNTLSGFPLLQEDNEASQEDTLTTSPQQRPVSPTSSKNHVSFSPDGTASPCSSDSTHQDSETGGTGSRLHRRRRGSSLVSKIPTEAEALTVLVGGVKFLEKPLSAFVRLGEELVSQDLTESHVPLRFLFLHIGPDDETTDYHEVGRAMATLMSDAHFHEVAYSANCKEHLMRGMDDFLDNSLVLPPGDWGEDLLLPAIHERNNLRRKKEDHKEAVEKYQKLVTEPLKHSRRPCGGMWKDLKNLLSRYPSDFKDALKPQVLLSIIFVYISFLAPAIAFGGLMAEVTGTKIGETETLFITGLGGILYGLLAVQPLTVLAFTGPILVFDATIFDVSQSLNIPYLEWRIFIGLWLMLILAILAVCELSFLVHYFTRFCEEVFIGIVAIIFIYEAGLSIFHIFERNPLCGLHYPCGEASHFNNFCQPLDDHHYGNKANKTSGSGYGYATTEMEIMDVNETVPSLPRGFRICNQPNTGLFSLLLAITTFLIALMLRKLRYHNFLGKKTRRLVSDFGMLGAISTMVLVAYLVRDLVPVETILAPPNYGVSNSTARDWIVNPFNGRLSIAAGIGAVVPAMLMAVLMFIENQLALITINKPEHKLRKPVGYHMDLFLVGLLAGVSGVLGTPFLCSAPVRSLQHLQALSVFTKKHAPGEKPRLIKIHEQRVTNIVVHILVILTPFASVILQAIPISVLLGVFIYLGFVSLAGVQITTRVKLFFMLPKHHPDEIYVRKVRTYKMHLYTAIQAACIAALYAIKLSIAAMAYPLIIVGLPLIRLLIGKTLYGKEEIEALDNEVDKEGDDDKGEFAASHVPY